MPHTVNCFHLFIYLFLAVRSAKSRDGTSKQLNVTQRQIDMSLEYFVRYRFNNDADPGEEDFGERDLAVETGAALTFDDPSYGQSLALDDTSLLATGDLETLSDDGNRAVTFWARTSTFSSPVFSYGSLAGPDGFTFYTLNVSGIPEFYDHTTKYPATTPLVRDTWYFYAVVYDSATRVLSMFVDGTLFHAVPVGVLTTGSSEALRIGTDGEGEFFTGRLLDFRMWDTLLGADVVQYMYGRGPNFEEPLDTNYFSSTLRTETIAGNLLCKSNLGVKPSGEVLYDSFYGHDSSSGLHEAARVEYSQNSSGQGVATLKVRHDGGVGVELAQTMEVTLETTTFSAKDTADDSTSSVVFSSEGVKLLPSSESSEKGCLIFGKGADFRIRVKEGLFTIESYNSASDSYVTKMEIGG